MDNRAATTKKVDTDNLQKDALGTKGWNLGHATKSWFKTSAKDWRFTWFSLNQNSYLDSHWIVQLSNSHISGDKGQRMKFGKHKVWFWIRWQGWRVNQQWCMMCYWYIMLCAIMWSSIVWCDKGWCNVYGVLSCSVLCIVWCDVMTCDVGWGVWCAIAIMLCAI